MTAFAEVKHTIWIAAPVATVRSQFGDLDHHIRRNVHPKLAFRKLGKSAGGERFQQEVKLLGITQRDTFERRWLPDGSIHDTSIEGFNKDGSLHFRFAESAQGGQPGTEVDITIRLPLPPLLGWLAPVLKAQVRKEVSAAALEDKMDIEQHGYLPAAA
jgi:hypothetical protein